MTAGPAEESVESSRAPSPVTIRGDLTRSISGLSTEQTPLLKDKNRSRVRIKSTSDLPGRLSRKHSHQGESDAMLLQDVQY